MQMTDSEIRTKHRDGTSIEILAQLNACDAKTIKNIVAKTRTSSALPDLPKFQEFAQAETKERTNANDLKQRAIKIKSLYDQGYSDPAIGEKLNVHAQIIYKWRKLQNLPSNSKKAREANKKEAPEKRINAVVDPDPVGTTLHAVAEDWIRESEAQFIAMQAAREQEEKRKIQPPMYFADISDEPASITPSPTLVFIPNHNSGQRVGYCQDMPEPIPEDIRRELFSEPEPEVDGIRVTPEPFTNYLRLRYALEVLKKAGDKPIDTEELKPRYIHNEERLQDIKRCLYLSLNRKKVIPGDWINEYNELVEKVYS